MLHASSGIKEVFKDMNLSISFRRAQSFADHSEIKGAADTRKAMKSMKRFSN